MNASRLYIYTLPKAGTYFLATLCSRFGWIDTGIHVLPSEFLDTKAFDSETAAQYPTKTAIKQPYHKTLSKIEEGALCFGHMDPLIIPPGLKPRFAILAGKRHPRDALVAEFIDFRFRRRDLPAYQIDAIPDHKVAFLDYLRHNGGRFLNHMGAFIAYSNIRNLDAYTSTRKLGEYLEIRFEDLFSIDPIPTLRKVANLFDHHLPDSELQEIFDNTCKLDNKTKSISESLPFQRPELWTPEAEALYGAMQFPRFARIFGYVD